MRRLTLSSTSPWIPTRSIRDAYFEWWTRHPLDGIALTVTFMPSWRGQLLTSAVAQATVRHFLHRLNRRALGRRRKSRAYLEVLSVREGATSAFDKRIHYHFYIGAPAGISHEQLCQMAIATWVRLDWASRDQNRARPEADKHWVSYILKLQDKPDYATSIDIENSFRLPDEPPRASS